MSHRLRGVDVAVMVVVLVAAAGVGAALVSTVTTDSQQARCAANLSKFGQALAAYEAQWGVFPPCDPWYLIPFQPAGHTDPILMRNPDDWTQRNDPPHGRLLHQMGYRPYINGEYGAIVYQPWEDYAYGFRMAAIFRGVDSVPPPAICPSAILGNVMSETSTELDPYHWYEAPPVFYKYAACYMVNRIFRSPTSRGRWPVRPDDGFEADFYFDGSTDNIFGRAETRVDAGSGVWSYHVQAVNSDEVLAPAKVLYLCDSLDYHTNGSVVEAPFGALGAGEQSAGMWYMQRGDTPPGAVILGSRHSGAANALYVDGHVSADGQSVRNRRGEMAIASTFSDFTVDNNLGNQHYTLPCGPYMDATAPGGGAAAPGDDEPPTVTAVWPGDDGASSPNATHITISFSEQVLINETNVTVNGGAVTADAFEYEPGRASFSLQFDDPLAAGTYQVTVGDAVTDRMGNQLDGDGNGAAGGDYLFEFNVREAFYPGTRGELPAAIDAAIDGDVIVLRQSRYIDQVNFQGKAITIRSADPTDPNVVAATIIDADGENRSAVVFVNDEDADSVLDGVTITGAGDSGIYIDGAGPSIRRCVIEQCVMHDYADGHGGGVYCMSGWPIIENCIIRYNEAEYGGGMYLVDSAAIVRNNLLQDNHAYEEGGAIYLALPDDLILNNTIVENSSGSGPLGGSVVTCVVAGHTVLASNIFWQNYDPDLVLLDAEPVVACNLFAVVPLDYEGHGNIAGDPLFVSGYQLSPYSPCINAGSPWYGPGPEATDLAGGRRISMDRVDMGAYELQAPFFAGSEPAADGTLPKTQNNLVELSFDDTAYLIGPAGLQIVPIGGDPNADDVGGGFTYELATAVEPNDTLRATETGAALANQTWYRLSRGEDLLVETFLQELCTLQGDANNTGRVTTADYSEVKAHIGEYTDACCDLNGSGRVTTADYSVVKAFLGDRAPTKP